MTLEKSLDYELNLEKVVLENIDIAYDDLLDKNYFTYSIHSLDASLNYLPDTIKCQVKSNITLEEAKLNNSFVITNKNINVATSLVFDRNSQKIIIEPSNFSFERANFTLEGYINLLNDGFIDLTVKGNDKDFSILNLFLKSTMVENIDEGDLFFNATVVGMLNKGIPQIECSFGIKDVKNSITQFTSTALSFSCCKPKVSVAFINTRLSALKLRLSKSMVSIDNTRSRCIEPSNSPFRLFEMEPSTQLIKVFCGFKPVIFNSIFNQSGSTCGELYSTFAKSWLPATLILKS